VDGIRKLFEAGKASPSDVCPSGFPLILRAMIVGSTDTCRLLLDEGMKLGVFESLGLTAESLLGDVIYWFRDSTRLARFTQTIDHALARGLELRPDEPDRIGPTRNPFFSLDRTKLTRRMQLSLLQYLTEKGFDREEQNSEGQTPLLHFAMLYHTKVYGWLQTLLAIRVNGHATDKYGRGALHSALIIATLPLHRSGCSTNCYCVDKVPWLQAAAATRDMVQAEGGEDTEGDEVEDRRVGEDVEEGGENGLTEHEIGKPRFGRDELPWVINDWNVESQPSAWCRLYSCYHSLELPRSRPSLYGRLHMLLEAGCDPNAKDNCDKTPSDFAMSNSRFWPDWEQALNDNGWIYDARQKTCIRRLDNAEE